MFLVLHPGKRFLGAPSWVIRRAPAKLVSYEVMWRTILRREDNKAYAECRIGGKIRKKKFSVTCKEKFGSSLLFLPDFLISLKHSLYFLFSFSFPFLSSSTVFVIHFYLSDPPMPKDIQISISRSGVTCKSGGNPRPQVKLQVKRFYRGRLFETKHETGYSLFGRATIRFSRTKNGEQVVVWCTASNHYGKAGKAKKETLS